MIIGRSEEGTDCARAIDVDGRLVEEFRGVPNSEAFLRMDLDSDCLHSTPRALLIIVNPGTYTIVAERSAVGRRGVRRRA